MHRDKIRQVLMANGFTIKQGQTDLKGYVYTAAEALLREAMPERPIRSILGHDDWLKLRNKAYGSDQVSWRGSVVVDQAILRKILDHFEPIGPEVLPREPLPLNQENPLEIESLGDVCTVLGICTRAVINDN